MTSSGSNRAEYRRSMDSSRAGSGSVNTLSTDSTHPPRISNGPRYVSKSFICSEPLGITLFADDDDDDDDDDGSFVPNTLPTSSSTTELAALRNISSNCCRAREPFTLSFSPYASVSSLSTFARSTSPCPFTSYTRNRNRRVSTRSRPPNTANALTNSTISTVPDMSTANDLNKLSHSALG